MNLWAKEDKQKPNSPTRQIQEPKGQKAVFLKVRHGRQMLKATLTGGPKPWPHCGKWPEAGGSALPIELLNWQWVHSRPDLRQRLHPLPTFKSYVTHDSSSRMSQRHHMRALYPCEITCVSDPFQGICHYHREASL